jgi:hypothetical protein
METFTAWMENGFLYGFLYITAAYFLARQDYLKSYWIPLTACAAVAAVGYITFWSYFASPTFGKIISVSIFSAALLANIISSGRLDHRDRESISVGCLASVIGALYIGILHLFPAHRDFYDLASNRFIVGLPGDNRLPFDFADLIYHGHRTVALGASWLTSDRPPLQEGWQLVSWPVTQALGFSEQAASGTASIWFQLSWVFAFYGLLCSMGMPRSRGIFWTMVVSLNGFFLLHTLFTWPKLAAGAFACGTFGMWILGGCTSKARGQIIGAIFAGLACLSHEGAAFVLIPFLPWVVWCSFRKEFTQWTLAAALFMLFISPWLAYQRYYAPPGNRLLKWHLGAQFAVDDRSVLQTISDTYRSLSWKQILEKKSANIAYQFAGDWSAAANGSISSVDGRRTEEYFHTFRAVGWWNLAALVFIFGLCSISWRQRIAKIRCQQWALGAWIVFSMTIWCSLMLTRTEIAQGSFAVMIAIFALYSCWIELAGRWLLPFLAALQTYTLATTWIPANSVVNGWASPSAIALIAAAAATAALMIKSELKSSDSSLSQSTMP